MRGFRTSEAAVKKIIGISSAHGKRNIRRDIKEVWNCLMTLPEFELLSDEGTP
jgi:hypothetical protein